MLPSRSVADERAAKHLTENDNARYCTGIATEHSAVGRAPVLYTASPWFNPRCSDYWGLAKRLRHRVLTPAEKERSLRWFESNSPSFGQAESYKTTNRWWTVTHL